MNTNTNSTNNESDWNKMAHIPFKKVVAFDLICMGIGVVIGIRIGVYLIASM